MSVLGSVSVNRSILFSSGFRREVICTAEVIVSCVCVSPSVVFFDPVILVSVYTLVCCKAINGAGDSKMVVYKSFVVFASY